MAIVLYSAMTAAEFRQNPAPAFPIAWMACHFSPYGTGLSNLPEALPKGSMLILNDRTPVFGHDPQRVAEQLEERAAQLECDGILLDFQRPAHPQVQAIAAAVAALPYPVGITPAYAQELECAVFLPPPPLTVPLASYLQPWQGRKIWLEAATERGCVQVNKRGSRAIDRTDTACPYPHVDDMLHCRYGMELGTEYIDFFLYRDETQLKALMQEGAGLGIQRFVGLYQQLGASFSQPAQQPTARFQP
jgi:hypothetical protein